MAKRPRSPRDSPRGVRAHVCNVLDCRRAFQTLQGLRLHKSQAQSANHKTARQQQSFDRQYDRDRGDIRRSDAGSPEASEPMHEQLTPNSRSPSPSPSLSSQDSSPPRVRKRARVTVEEVEDEDAYSERTPSPDRHPSQLRAEIDGLPRNSEIWVESFSDDEDLQAGKTYGRCQTTYEKYEARLAASGFDPAVRPWTVFENEVESEIGLWLAGASNLSHGGIDEFLKLPSVCCLCL